MKIIHTLKPIYNEYSKVLILGSIPSIISRTNNFYYANKSNRFWPIIEHLYNVEFNNNNDKSLFLLKKNIALYDVIKECNISGSSDSTIKNIIPNDIKIIINNSNIKTIFLTGKKAFTIYKKYFKDINIEYYYLPSPSSANASFSLKKLISIYSIIKEKLD